MVRRKTKQCQFGSCNFDISNMATILLAKCPIKDEMVLMCTGPYRQDITIETTIVTHNSFLPILNGDYYNANNCDDLRQAKSGTHMPGTCLCSLMYNSACSL